VLERKIAELAITAVRQPNYAEAHYTLALAQSYLAEVALELRDKNMAKNVAEAGIKSAERAVTLRPDSSEFQPSARNALRTGDSRQRPLRPSIRQVRAGFGGQGHQAGP